MSEPTTAKPKRRRSGTADWHMSREAVSLSVPQVFAWSDRECLDFMVEVRFGSWDTVGCPHCGTTGKHYWRPLQKRWKCSGCGSTFSVTSGTVFAGRKLPLQTIIAGTLLWLNSAAGQPALELICVVTPEPNEKSRVAPAFFSDTQSSRPAFAPSKVPDQR